MDGRILKLGSHPNDNKESTEDIVILFYKKKNILLLKQFSIAKSYDNYIILRHGLRFIMSNKLSLENA